MSGDKNIKMTDTKEINAKIKWFNTKKGFGFVVSDEGVEDIFLHFSCLEEAGIHQVEDGETIRCIIGGGRTGQQVLKILPSEEQIERGSSTVKKTRKFMRVSVPRFEQFPDDVETREIEGKMKWYNPSKGFGFMVSHEGQKEVFIHGALLRHAGIDNLQPGQNVKVRVAEAQNGLEARKLWLL